MSLQQQMCVALQNKILTQVLPLVSNAHNTMHLIQRKRDAHNLLLNTLLLQ